MKNRTTVFLCAVIISSGVFARGTRSIAVSVNATDGVVQGATLTLLPAKNSAGVVGLWDFKSGTFRTSSGTVAFSAGEAESVSAHLQTTEPYRVRCRGIAVFAR